MRAICLNIVAMCCADQVPYAFLCTLPTYAFGEMWIGVTLAVLVDLLPVDTRVAGVAFYMSLITVVGTSSPY